MNYQLKYMKPNAWIVLTAGLGLATATATASVIFAENPTGAWNVAGNALTAGTPFTVGASTLMLTSLGFFDQNQDGLENSHMVGIYDQAHTLLGSVTVKAGTASTLHDGARWEQLNSPIALSANTMYMLAATFLDTGDKANISTKAQVTLDPNFTLALSGFTYKPGATLNYPSTPGGLIGSYAFGANMEVVAAPEPSQWAMMGVVVMGITGYAARRFRTKANSPAQN